jgi:hypothetical protein
VPLCLAANAGRHSRSDLLQKLIAGGVPKLVVDGLEAVNIDQQQADGLVLSRRLLYCLPEPIKQQPAIRKSGQQVTVSKLACLCQVALEPGDLAHEPRVDAKQGSQVPVRRRGTHTPSL